MLVEYLEYTPRTFTLYTYTVSYNNIIQFTVKPYRERSVLPRILTHRNKFNQLIKITIYCTRLRKLTPTLIALDFGCAFMLGLRDDSRIVFAKVGRFNQAAPYMCRSSIIPDSGQLTVFTAQTHISSAKPNQISAKAHQDGQHN